MPRRPAAPFPTSGHFSTVLKLAVPLIVTQYSVAIMHLTDAWMVAKLGTDALAAISPAIFAGILLIGFGEGFNSAVNSLVSVSNGRKHRSDCGIYAWQGIWFAILIGFFAIALAPTAAVLFAAFGHEPDVQALEIPYFQLSLFGVGPAIVANVVGVFFVATDRPATAMTATLLGTTSNIAFNYVLMFGQFGLAPMGLQGAALGTVLATVVQVLFLFGRFLRKSERNRFHTHAARISPSFLRKLVANGLPSGTQVVLDVITWAFIIFWLVGHFGTVQLAATAVVLRLIQFTFQPNDGIGTALISLVSSSIGKEDIKSARRLASAAMIVTASYMLALGLVFALLGSTILSLFELAPDVHEIAKVSLLVIAPFLVFDAMNTTYSDALRGAGDTLWLLSVNLATTLLVLCGGGLYVVNHLPHWGAPGVWLVDGLYLLIQGGIFFFRWRSSKWQSILAVNPVQTH